MILTENTASSFTPCPAGSYLASLRRIIDLGTQTSTFEGKTTSARKVLLTWEIVDADTFTEDGKPYLVSKRYTRSLHEKSALRRDLASWRGRDFTPEELRGFDLDSVLGRNCMLSVVHVDKAGSTFANVGAVMKAPKSLTGADPSEPLTLFDLDKPDWQVFEHLGDKLKAQIMAAPEYMAARKPKAPPPLAEGETAFADMADDVPF
jgi:hypothetical protein